MSVLYEFIEAENIRRRLTEMGVSSECTDLLMDENKIDKYKTDWLTILAHRFFKWFFLKIILTLGKMKKMKKVISKNIMLQLVLKAWIK